MIIEFNVKFRMKHSGKVSINFLGRETAQSLRLNLQPRKWGQAKSKSSSGYQRHDGKTPRGESLIEPANIKNISDTRNFCSNTSLKETDNE
tara:strand:+ start:690 stop:962 length:273 start_codon:yes stop_codon:yes gene_type:complete